MSIDLYNFLLSPITKTTANPGRVSIQANSTADFSVYPQKELALPRKYKPKNKLSNRDLSEILPTQLEVLRCIKRLKCPAFTSLTDKIDRSITPNKQPMKMSKCIEIPKDANEFAVLLANLKKTDRVLRQGAVFFTAIREIKPKITLLKRPTIKIEKKICKKQTEFSIVGRPKSVPPSRVRLKH